MEGPRAWAFTAPAFGGHVERAPPGPPAGIYCPKGWRKRRRGGSDAEREVAGPRAKRPRSAAAAPPPAPPPAALPPTLPPNPAELAALRCSWPHPAVLELLAQQCWPAAGAAALVRPAADACPAPPPASRQPGDWNRMLPSLSLPHAPLNQAQQQELLDGSGPGSATQLPQPNVLVGYQDDWLEVAPQVLPLWQATPLAPFAGPKPLLHYLVCPDALLPQAQQFVRDVGSLYETCNLGSHQAASGSGTAVLSFRLEEPPGGAAASEGAAAAWAALPPAARHLAHLRHACERVQRQLLVDPPEELREQQGSSLEEGAEPAVVVYLASPLGEQAHLVAALLEAAACLAPCTPLGAAAAQPSIGPPLLPAGSLDLACSTLLPPAPVSQDRPAGATPAADSSRAPGSRPPPEEHEDEDPAQQAQGQEQQQQQQQAEQGAEQQRYHGAAQGLHHQQRSDFRQLPLRHVPRPPGSPPINVVLQVLTPEALADLTGTAARCTAFAAYSKVRRQMVPTSEQLLPLGQQEQRQGAAGDARPAAAEPPPAVLPFCSQPLLTLASPAPAEPPASQHVEHPAAAQQQQQQQQQQQEGSSSAADSGAAPRTLHCAYQRPPPGSTLVPLAFTDSRGELLHAELLDAAVGGSLGCLDSGGEGRADEARHVCRLVLRRCAELLHSLRAATNPPNVLHSIAIAGSGMQPDELRAWRQLLEAEPAATADLPAGAGVAVLEVQALAPARFPGPDPPTGCKLLLLPDSTDETEAAPGLRACVAWLPPAGGSSASSLLPNEHDTVRRLEVALVACHRPSNLAHAAEQQQQQQEQQGERSERCDLQQLASELHGLAWLHAAFQGACLRTLAGGGQPAECDAHLPLHAVLATRLRSLLAEASACIAGRIVA